MFNQNVNSGYVGYSMSIRANEAYSNGEMPLSKWTKLEILDNLEFEKVDIKCLSKYTKRVLAEYFLIYSGWHHTSKCFNETKFYSLSSYAIERAKENMDLVIQDLEKIKTKFAAEKKGCDKHANQLKIVEIEYGEWEGTRRHPKLVQYTAIGVQKGNCVWISADSKKNLNGRHIKIIKTYSRAPKGEGHRLNKIKKKIMK